MLVNPYKNVKWDSFHKLQGNTHNHGFYQWHLDNMYDNGSRFIGLHPHYGKPLFPAKEYDMEIPEDVIEYALTEHYGNESYPHPNHFCAIGSTLVSDEDSPHSGFKGGYKDFLDAVRNDLQVEGGGGVHWNHPGTINPVPGNPIFEGMKKMYDYAPDIFLGVEFYNNSQGKTYEGKDPWMFGYWDALLATGRHVWGFANPDYEARRLDPYPDWEGKAILLLEDKTRENALRAIRNGEFFLVLYNNGFYFDEISNKNDVVTVKLNDTGNIQFVTAKRRVEFKDTKESNLKITPDDVYVRIEAKKGEEQIFSQALMFEEAGEDDKKRLVNNRTILI